MSMQKQVGDAFVISVVRGSGGGIRSREKVNGAFCYVKNQPGVEIQEGDLWKVRYLGLNTRGSMSHVEAVQILDSTDGTHHIVSQFAPHFSLAIRRAEEHLSRMRKYWEKASHMFAEHLIGVAEGPNSDYPYELPVKYVRDRLATGLAIRQSCFGEDTPLHLPQLDKLADLELELGNVEAAQKLLEQCFVIAGKFGHADYVEKSGIKLARIHYSQKRFDMAAHFYSLCADDTDLPHQDRRDFADACAKIGKSDVAFGILDRLTTDLMQSLAEAKAPMLTVIATMSPHVSADFGAVERIMKGMEARRRKG